MDENLLMFILTFYSMERLIILQAFVNFLLISCFTITIRMKKVLPKKGFFSQAIF